MAYGRDEPQVALTRPGVWLVMVLTGVVMGYSARIAFGCNVGAYFSGISSGSLHGWVWFAAAFAGSVIGIRFRNKLLKTSTDAAAKTFPQTTLFYRPDPGSAQQIGRAHV